MNIKPNRTCPKRVTALLWGRALRYEFVSGGGSYWDLATRHGSHPSKLWFLWNRPATVRLPSVAVLTHLQKKMKWGILLTHGKKSLCLHVWFHWHMQEFQDENAYTPNSERGVYFRTPGWRWDLEEGMIRTGGRVPGAHWD